MSGRALVPADDVAATLMAENAAVQSGIALAHICDAERDAPPIPPVSPGMPMPRIIYRGIADLYKYDDDDDTLSDDYLGSDDYEDEENEEEDDADNDEDDEEETSSDSGSDLDNRSDDSDFQSNDDSSDEDWTIDVLEQQRKRKPREPKKDAPVASARKRASTTKHARTGKRARPAKQRQTAAPAASTTSAPLGKSQRGRPRGSLNKRVPLRALPRVRTGTLVDVAQIAQIAAEARKDVSADVLGSAAVALEGVVRDAARSVAETAARWAAHARHAAIDASDVAQALISTRVGGPPADARIINSGIVTDTLRVAAVRALRTDAAIDAAAADALRSALSAFAASLARHVARRAAADARPPRATDVEAVRAAAHDEARSTLKRSAA